MKRLIKTAIITSIISIAVFSTLAVRAQLSVGARAGANFATEPANGLYHVFLARPYLGIFGQYNLNNSFGLQLGINYSGEGANYKDLSSGDVYHVRHAFLTIPFLAQYRFGFGGYIEAGPQFGFLLSAKEQNNSDPSIDAKKYYKGTDISAGLGLGYDFKGSLQGFGISARYMRGLTDINKIALQDNDHIKSRVLSVGLTYKLSKHVAKGKL
ncbi:MAG: PorT family protein [Chitinophagaceae bacterium]|nr:PorT family protein [Chitinophagaceae bacterium]